MNGKQWMAAIATLLVSGATFAGNGWDKQHPRRTEVNRRLHHENHRINEGVKSGRLSPEQARQLHAEDHAIRQQERAMASQHGGHITRAEQRQLNREENQVSRQIYQEKH